MSTADKGESVPKIDLHFHVMGKMLPVDHGFALYAAVSRMLPSFHEDDDSGMALIRGRYCGDGLLDISPHSDLIMRLEHDKVSVFLNLAGKKLDISGHTLYVGIPRSVAIKPHQSLYAHMVTTRNGHDQKRFIAELENQFQRTGIRAKYAILKRKTCRIHGRQVVGYSVCIENISDKDSITLQENGLGGRRKMGCGFFVPWER